MSGEAEHEEQGFRQPPEQVTEACIQYIGRISELRRFNKYIYEMLGALARLDGIVAEDKVEVMRKRRAEILSIMGYKEQIQFVHELVLSRTIETFSLYLAHVLRIIFEIQPNILKSSSKVTYEEILEYKSYEEIVMHLSEKKIHELSYSSLHNLENYISEKIGIQLFASEGVYDTLTLASEIRNLITHNDCTPNSVFLKRTHGIDNPLSSNLCGKLIIEEDWLHKTIYTIDGVVFDFDTAAADKFGLEIMNPFEELSRRWFGSSSKATGVGP